MSDIVIINRFFFLDSLMNSYFFSLDSFFWACQNHALIHAHDYLHVFVKRHNKSQLNETFHNIKLNTVLLYGKMFLNNIILSLLPEHPYIFVKCDKELTYDKLRLRRADGSLASFDSFECSDIYSCIFHNNGINVRFVNGRVWNFGCNIEYDKSIYEYTVIKFKLVLDDKKLYYIPRNNIVLYKDTKLINANILANWCVVIHIAGMRDIRGVIFAHLIGALIADKSNYTEL